MRCLVIASVVLSGLGAPAGAANGPWEPAPVPRVGAGDTVQPAARTGTLAPNAADTPFSGVPSGSVAAGGATSSNMVNGVQTPDTSGK